MESIIKNLPGERWKVVSLPTIPSKRKRLAVSDKGRVKSYTKTGKESILMGTVQNGYEIIKLKLFTERSPIMEKKLESMRKQISRHKLNLISFRKQTSDRKAAKQIVANARKQVESIKQLLPAIQKKYTDEIHKDELARMINVSYLTHRLVAEYFCKRAPKKMLVIHLDFNKRNNKPSNLKWVNQEECTVHQLKNPNVIKAFKARKGKRYEDGAGIKLNQTKVAVIKRQLFNGVKPSKIAKKHNVSETQIRRIERGDNWGDIKMAKS